MPLRDHHAGRQPGAEHPLDIDADDVIALPEYAADLPQEELEKLVLAQRQRRLGDALPSDLPGTGARRDPRC